MIFRYQHLTSKFFILDPIIPNQNELVCFIFAISNSCNLSLILFCDISTEICCSLWREMKHPFNLVKMQKIENFKHFLKLAPTIPMKLGVDQFMVCIFIYLFQEPIKRMNFSFTKYFCKNLNTCGVYHYNILLFKFAN